jgi:FkbM family methyltransferase
VKQFIRTAVQSSLKVVPFKKQLFGTLRLIHPPKRIWSMLSFEGSFQVAVNNTASFRMWHHGYSSEQHMFWRGLFSWGEDHPLQLWVKLCADAHVIFDVGANIGVYSLVAKTINPTARVFGFEPVGHLHRKFARNCELNGFDIACEHTALSNQNGSAVIYIKPGGITTASLQQNALRSQSEVIETATISRYAEEMGIERIDLMKIDVEGHEPRVLEGMGPKLLATTPTIIIEILSDMIGAKIESILKGHKYLYFNIDEYKGPIRRSHITASGLTRHSRNFLLCQMATARKLKLI